MTFDNSNGVTKPAFPEGYKRWLRDEFDVQIAVPQEQHYYAISRDVVSAIEKWDVWCEIRNNFKEFDDKYTIKNGYPLISEWGPQIHVKPYLSFLEKTYRRNIFNNDLFPDKPPKGWLVPPDWYSAVDDIVRTTFVVKYLDGIQFMIDEISNIAEKYEVECVSNLESKMEGYYAGHLYLKKTVEIPKFTWDTEEREFIFEIQITTQVKEVIKRLLHKYYEEQRVGRTAQMKDWQWEYKSDRFIAHYLGHILHYVEGMILEVRDRSREAKDEG